MRTVTNATGFFTFSDLPVGSYTVTVQLSGFRRFVQTNIKLSAAAQLSVDAQLEVGNLNETVEVKASTSAVQTGTAQVARTVDSRQIQELTLNGRNPIFLALLKPGVRGGLMGSFAPDSVTNGSFSINGARDDEYVVMVDGAVATRTRSSGSMLGSQDVETVEEVQILTANYRAEYGRSSAGQIRFVTKSGTREFHGDALENYRNASLDANSWIRNRSGDPRLSKGPDPFSFHQVGFHPGGPLVIPGLFNADRTKMFFFWGEEWNRRRDTQTSTAVVPTAAMRGGDFGELLNPANLFFGRARVIVDPLTGQLFRGSGTLARIFGNWDVSSIYQYQSGGPFSIRSNDDFAGVGPGSGAQFWNQIADPHVPQGAFTDSVVWFDKNAFARPASGTFGTQTRNGLRNPPFWTTDFGLRKTIPLRDQQRIQLRLETFNLLNHPNWGGANSNPTSGSFGLITGKTGERRIQLAAKYMF